MKKRIYTKTPQRLKDYWKKVMSSNKKAMSWGAQKVDRIITWARKDNWRRRD